MPEVLPEPFIDERDFASLLDWTSEQLTAARNAGRFIPPHGEYHGRALWWRRDVDSLLERIGDAKRALQVEP